jgi:hypothetical protein
MRVPVFLYLGARYAAAFSFRSIDEFRLEIPFAAGFNQCDPDDNYRLLFE